MHIRKRNRQYQRNELNNRERVKLLKIDRAAKQHYSCKTARLPRVTGVYALFNLSLEFSTGERSASYGHSGNHRQTSSTEGKGGSRPVSGYISELK